jgi:competence protein ComEA
MAAVGAPGSPDDITRTVQYLGVEFGLVNVNAATQAELQEVGDLSAAEAAAIVEFRTHEGRIRSLDDLKKVPGLDPTKLEGRKERFVFDVGV